METCKYCSSKEVVRVRHDSDWGGGNTMYVINDDHDYAESKKFYEHLFRNFEFFDIDTTYCFSCHHYDVLDKKVRA